MQIVLPKSTIRYRFLKHISFHAVIYKRGRTLRRPLKRAQQPPQPLSSLKAAERWSTYSAAVPEDPRRFSTASRMLPVTPKVSSATCSDTPAIPM